MESDDISQSLVSTSTSNNVLQHIEKPRTGIQSYSRVMSADQHKILDPTVRSGVSLPVGHVPKGRPKGKERLTAIGRKRKGL